MFFTFAVIFILFLIVLKWLAFAAATALALVSVIIASRKRSHRTLLFTLIASTALAVALYFIPGVEHYRMYGMQTELNRSTKIIEASMVVSLIAAVFVRGNTKWISGAAALCAFIAFVIHVP